MHGETVKCIRVFEYIQRILNFDSRKILATCSAPKPLYPQHN